MPRELTQSVNPEPATIEEEPKKTGLGKDLDLSRFTSVSLRDKIVFAKNLQIMLKTGLSLAKALNILATQSDNQKFKKILLEIQTGIEQGGTFASALKKHPKEFNELFVSMIESGELAGNLEEVLDYLQTQMKKDHELIAKVRGALIYPAVVVVAMVGIGIGLMVFVIPRLISIFEELKTDLPLPTKVLIGLSNFLTSQGLWVILGAVLLFFLVRFIKKTSQGKKFFHYLMLRAPVMGPIVHKINLARFARTLSSLIKTDLPIIQSFNITSQTLGNVYYKQSLITSAEEIKKGVPMNQTLVKHKKLFPPMVIQMVTVGEESGEVDEVLVELANFYEEDIDQTMENLPQLIEPLLILVLGAGVGAMAVSIIMPLYSLSESF